MIFRIVQMTFRPESVATFQAHFETHQQQIRHFEGCQYLQVFQDKNTPNILISYSIWDSEQSLENYRQSAFFQEVWAFTKQHFAARPQAWTLDRRYELP